MSPPREVDEVALLALDLLESERVSYVVMGGQAVNIWGVPRTTFDVDFEVDLPRDRLGDFLDAAARAGFFFDEHLARGFTDRVGGEHSLVTIKRWVGNRAVHVDLFLTETPFLRRIFDRAVTAEIAGRPRRVVTAADLVLFKLLAWRPKDRLDLLNIFTVQGVPEEAYLRAEAERLGVRERLDEILRDWNEDRDRSL